jgi:hypothetical protein
MSRTSPDLCVGLGGCVSIGLTGQHRRLPGEAVVAQMQLSGIHMPGAGILCKMLGFGGSKLWGFMRIFWQDCHDWGIGWDQFRVHAAHFTIMKSPPRPVPLFRICNRVLGALPRTWGDLWRLAPLALRHRPTRPTHRTCSQGTQVWRHPDAGFHNPVPADLSEFVRVARPSRSSRPTLFSGRHEPWEHRTKA